MYRLFPGYGKADARQMQQVRQLARRLERLERRGSFRLQKKYYYILLRRIAALFLPGNDRVKVARQFSGKSGFRQFLERVILFFFFRLDAKFYYHTSLYLPDLYAEAGDYIGLYDCVLFGRILNQNELTVYTEDKQLFQDFCTANDILTPDILTVVNPATVDGDSFRSSLLPVASREGVFFKPIDGFMGGGAGRLNFDGRETWSIEFSDAPSVSGSWEAAFSALQAKDTAFIFQKRLTNHPVIAQINPNVLHSLRVTTFFEGGRIQILAAELRLGASNSVTDNVSLGGVGAPVNLETGRLGKGTQISHATLPNSVKYFGEAEIDLETIEVPYLADALEVAVAIHSSLPGIFSLGHDIAILPDGPVAVETNHIWGDFQKFDGFGYGASKAFIAGLLESGRRYVATN